MSTGLSIISASYGTSGATNDVTATVASLIKDGSLNFTVSPTTLNTNDPAPGQLKSVTVVYTINGGSSNTLIKNDNDIVSIDAPPVTTASGLQVIKAEYGYPGNYTDVTDAVQSLVSNGSINLTVGFSAVGIPDPNPNKQKELRVEYTLNNKKAHQTVKDGKPFNLSAPPAEAVSNTSPSKSAGSVMYILFKNVAYFFLMFLYTISIFAAIEYGNQFLSPMLFGALAFFMPLFSFWGLPVLTFWIRLFRTDNFIY